MYDGCSLFDFGSALEASLTKKRRRGSLSAEERYWRGSFEAPSADALRRHGDRYGPGFVAETASVFGVDLRVRASGPARLKRQRRTSAELRAEALELRGRGLVVAAIADVLNVSDRRVKGLLAGPGLGVAG